MVMPILACRDLAASLAYYTESLGWTKAFAMPGPDGTDVFAIVQMNDQVVFGLSAMPAPEPKGNGVVLMCYVADGVDIDGYFSRCESQGATIAKGIRDEYWGDRVFDVTDSDGYSLSICKTVRQMSPEDIATASQA